MAQIIVRNLDDNVRDRLRDRASVHGRSMEEEVRDILRAAVNADTDVDGPERFGTWASKQFAKCHLKEGEIPEWRGSAVRTPTFDE